MRILPLLAVVLGAAFISTASAADTDIIPMAGKYKKTPRTTVQVGTTKYVGKSAVIRFKAGAAGLPASIKITASVKSRGVDVKVDNELKFKGPNRIEGKNLAPGVTTDAKFKGHFTTAPGVITFSGKFKAGATGTFAGTVTQAGTKLIVAYTLTVGEDTEPNYSYKYVAGR